jgi:hypothetical protein
VTELRTARTAAPAPGGLALVIAGWVKGRDRRGGERQPRARQARAKTARW